MPITISSLDEIQTAIDDLLEEKIQEIREEAIAEAALDHKAEVEEYESSMSFMQEELDDRDCRIMALEGEIEELKGTISGLKEELKQKENPNNE